MKLHFEADLPYQASAIEAVCDLFRGQEICRTEFTVTMRAARPDSDEGAKQVVLEGMLATEQGGIGNRLTLLDDEIEGNLRAVQLRNGLPPTSKLSPDFTVEMETGTGKTYVYLRTVFELNRRFGFTKFVVVVPSVAIKEGVNKTLQITREHFEALYPSAKGYEFFQYDSAKLGQVRNYATSPNVQIMVITVGAINKFGNEEEAAAEEADEALRREKSKNVMYRASEKTGGEKPIDLVRATRPILIVDEPQSVDGGIDGRGKKAMARMHPLCTLRYSATHVDKHNMVYRLDAVAYSRYAWTNFNGLAAPVGGGLAGGFALLGTNDPSWLTPAKQATFDLNRDFYLLGDGMLRRGTDHDKAAIAAFVASGKKLLSWSDAGDPLVSASDHARNHATMVRLASGLGLADPRANTRLFIVPASTHGAGGDLSQIDWLSAIIDWVENNKAPAQLTYAFTVGSTKRSLPVCEYPQYAKYNGSGDVNTAASFSCTTP